MREPKRSEDRQHKLLPAGRVPTNQNRTQGSARGAPGNWCPYLNRQKLIHVATRPNSTHHTKRNPSMSSRRNTTFAGHPGRIHVDRKKLDQYEKNFQGCIGLVANILFGLFRVPGEVAAVTEHAQKGDCNAAAVINLDPLIVAAYSDELDAVALLKFSQRERTGYQLEVGTMLVTANKYFSEVARTGADDVSMGPGNHGRWQNFQPIILNFITSDSQRLEEIYGGIPEDQWQRCLELGTDKWQQFPDQLRNGSPFLSTKAYIDNASTQKAPGGR